MFKKLLSNLPFNPSLLSQVAFYARRVHDESMVRRAGLALVVLSMLVQMFAVISPSESSVQASTNDIISGGFDNRDQATLHCLNTSIDFQTILDYYGVDCGILSRAETVWIRSTDYDNKLDSMGRNPQPATNPRNGKPSNQYSVVISGRTYYMKNLWYWDSGAYSSYQVLKMTNKHGQTIFIMYDCGNIVTIDQYTPPTPPPPPPVEPPPPPPPTPTDECPNVPGDQTSVEECDVCPNRDGIQYMPDECDVCPNKDGTQLTIEECDVCPNRGGVQYTLEECDVCPNISGDQTSADECYACPEAQTDDGAEACLDFDKTARNDTQSINDANGTTAEAGDIIEYSLSVKNTGVVDFLGFGMQENLADIIEYAEIIDLDGGEYDEGTHIASWPSFDVPAGQTITKRITIKIMDPIPQTPASSSNPGSFDLIMTNVFYDKSINIHLPPNVPKRIEIVSKTMPNTGPGESLAVGFLVMAVAGYFFARSRVMATELEIVKHEYSGGTP